MERKATAIWKGNLKEGMGTISTESQVLSHAPYSFGARFEDQKGTNPEELIAAGHAGCFSMALSAELEKLTLTADFIETKAQVNLEKVGGGYSVTDIHLSVSAQIPGATDEQFEQATETAKKNCPISKLLNVPITLEKKLSRSVIPPLQEAS